MSTAGNEQREEYRGNIWPALSGLLALAVIAAAGSYGYITAEISFWLLTCALVGYLVLESVLLAASKEDRWLLTPPVVISVFTFGLNFGVTNIVYALRGPLENGMRTYRLFGYEWMTWSMIYAFVGAISLWVGYK